ncbi:MAG: adenylate/guanylate cyclase domain-containing protein [Verrucomicrobia bacterium]|nr:adenylate/guanylate cyclase domain-containing protein [Verrucomicrobiota bacterium]
MLEFLTRRAKWIIAAFAVLVFFFANSELLKDSWFWQNIEGGSIDLRYGKRGGSHPNPNIVVIGIQGSSFAYPWEDDVNASEELQLMQAPWPWDRRVYAGLLEKLVAAGAKVVMFDLVFAGVTEGDEIFAQALQKHEAKVVIGSMLARSQNNYTDVQYVMPNESLLSDPNQPIVGFVTTWPDGDGVTRRARFHGTIFDEMKFSLSAVSAQKFAGVSQFPPLHDSNFIDFAGPNGTYEVFPIENVFVESIWQTPPLNSGKIFKDKIVLVGPYAEILQDFHETPWGTMAGPEVQANMLATLLDNSFLRDSSKGVNQIVTLGMLTFAALICIFMRSAWIQGVSLAVVAGGFMLVAQQMFSVHSLVIPVVPPLFGLVVTGMGGIGFRYLLEQIEKKRVRSVLDKYVSKNVAKTILGDKRSFVESLRGRKQAVTVLFSDIRGFTSMTEGTDATTLVSQLNEYFIDMVGIVHQHDGTLQKFIGDAIMAAWGDTHSNGLDVDARRAIKTALDMRAALTKLNEGWAGKDDRIKLSIGVGVNHGEVVVGNIGHPDFRMEFTVLGDGVNLAARLESATKQFKTDLLVGQEAEKLTRDHFIFRSVGAIAFKGKTQPVEVYMVLGDRSQPAPGWLAVYHEALQLYRKRCFDQAIVKFLAVAEQIGGDDYLCGMYLERCKTCMKESLPEKWDGSFALTEK